MNLITSAAHNAAATLFTGANVAGLNLLLISLIL